VSAYAEHLRPFLPYVPADLISQRCLTRILSVTDALPPALGTGPFMFECSLDDRPVADFSVAVIPSRGDLPALSSSASADLTGIARFARCATDPSTALGRSAIEQVWLEFDVCLTPAGPGGAASVFVGLDYESPADPDLRRTACEEHLGRAEEALLGLRGRPTSAATLSTLRRCFSFLPAGARLLFVAAMTSRDTDDVRVVVSGSELDAMLRYLGRLGLAQPIENLALVTEVADLTDHMWLAFDATDGGVAPRIGFDCYATGIDEPDDGRWVDLLDLLVDEGVCTAGKRDALLAAADMRNISFDGSGWPESMRKVATILGPAGLDRIRLGIHHIKVIDRPGLPLEGKAYLCGGYGEQRA
jgi:hypothetical protein